MANARLPPELRGSENESQCLPARSTPHATHLSSFCSRVRGLAEPDESVGLVADVVLEEPPPPRNGFAMRPKLSGDEAAAF